MGGIIEAFFLNSQELLSSLPFQLQENNIFWLMVWKYDLTDLFFSLSLTHFTKFVLIAA